LVSSVRRGSADAIPLQGGRPCEWELRGRESERQNQQGPYARLDYKGYTHHASRDEPPYEIKGDKTDHIAMHEGAALTRINRLNRGRSIIRKGGRPALLQKLRLIGRVGDLRAVQLCERRELVGSITAL
jgi:hypothetical protein